MKLFPSKETIDQSLAFLLLRFWLGMRAVMTGIEKYSAKVDEARPVLDEDGLETGASVMVKVKEYAWEHYHAVPQVFANKFNDEPLLFAWVREPFYQALGIILIVLGVMTILGIAMRVSLFLQGLLYIALTFGFVLLAVDEGVAQLAIHTLLCAVALYWVKYNCFTLTTKW